MFSTAQLEKTCACVGKTLEVKLKNLGARPTSQQMFKAASDSTQECAEPYARENLVRQCIENEEMRKKLRVQIGFSEEQFDRYCTCSVNLVYDEAARWVNPPNSQTQQSLNEKSYKLCLMPIKAGIKQE